MSREPPARPELLEQLNRASQQLSAATIMFHQTVADRLGLNPTDHKCVGFLLTEGPLTAGELAALTGLTTGAITGVLDRLEKAGYVRREDDPKDRRRVVVRVVARRLRDIERLFESLGATMGELSSRYSDEQLVTILDFMSQSQQRLQAETVKLRQEGESVRKRKQASDRSRHQGQPAALDDRFTSSSPVTRSRIRQNAGEHARILANAATNEWRRTCETVI